MSQRGPLVFRLGAICNWLVTTGAIVAPTAMFEAFGIPPANYPFLVRIWAGMAFLFGCMFWEIAGDMRGRRALIKYAWIEKCITAVSVTVAWVAGDAPTLLFALIVLTDWLWIPPFFFFDAITRGGEEPRAQRGPAPG